MRSRIQDARQPNQWRGRPSRMTPDLAVSSHPLPPARGRVLLQASSSSIIQASGIDEFHMLLTASPAPPRYRCHHSKGPCCGSTHQGAWCCSLQGGSSSICAAGRQHRPLQGYSRPYLPSRLQSKYLHVLVTWHVEGYIAARDASIWPSVTRATGLSTLIWYEDTGQLANGSSPWL